MSATTLPVLPVVILISGRGSNLQAIIDSAAAGELPVEIRAVISNRPGVAGLSRAARAGIRTAVVDHTAYGSRRDFDRALQQCIDRYRPGLVVLAGFMRLLTPEFVRHYHGRLLNIHPSLLPEFPGLDTHRRVLESGCREHGASIHFVTEEMDGGPVVLQARVPILPGDTAQGLAQRVLEQEHRIFPLAIRWFAERRLGLAADGQVLFDGRPLSRPWMLDSDSEIPC
ncbi:MAG: phosphoribosylglycinamide formyltransferase [Gammaproteobacteria bacterium]|jgi:phosphoribosylglycinamide formyltransferase-1